MNLLQFTSRAGLAVALAAAAGGAAGAADDVDRLLREQAASAVVAWVDRDFELPAKLQLDPVLRRDLEGLGVEHRARVAALAAAWAEEELPLVPQAERRQGLVTRLLARYLNERALWQLDSTGESFDRITLNVIREPGTCAARQNLSALATWAAMLQRMAPEDRATVMAAQRVLLSRWSQPRAIPERPLVPLKERTLAALKTLRGTERPAREPPLPPALAWSQLRTPPKRLDEGVACALAAWGLTRDEAASLSVGERAAQLRYWLVDDGLEALRQPADVGDEADAYPRVARRFGVEGVIGVRGRVRAAGPGLDEARVVDRAITVPGVRGVRPVFFETLLDSPSLARASKVVVSAPVRDGEARVQFKWSLQ